MTIENIITSNINKIVISKPRAKAAEFKKITITKKGEEYFAEKLTERQAFHEKINSEVLCDFCKACLSDFAQLNAWDMLHEYSLLASKKGSISIKKRAVSQAVSASATPHNREKAYIIPAGTVVPALVDMGVFSAEGKIINSMYDKFRQINRFIEIIDDAIPDKTKSLSVIDFGCGKSYLTFILYYYLTQIKGIDANIIGLDLKEDVIKKCNAATKKYGYDKLRFEVGDISGYRPQDKVDMVISLHACDVATDFALYNAVKWGARMIFSVPCCQHELNSQIHPVSLNALTRYGIIAERFASLSTDAIRANLLTAAGYKTQVLEFVDLSHTPKNLLLRATKSNVSQCARAQAVEEVLALMRAFSFEPRLYNLFVENNIL